MDGTTKKNESGLVSGLRENNPESIKEFYTLHFPAVRRYVMQNSGTSDDAKDVFQEAMVVMWMRIKERRLGETEDFNIGGFVYRVAKNKWLDHLRSATHRRTVSTMEHIEQNGIEAESGSEEQRIDHLMRIYCKLDGRCQQVLDMFYYEKRTMEQIASEIGVDVGSVRTIKYRCMMKLRKYHLEQASLVGNVREDD